MKANIFTHTQQILADRLIAALLIAIISLATMYCLYVGFSLHPNDLQVAVHYSAYGETSFYRDKWYYLISFIFFGSIVAVIHSALVVKLYLEDHRQLAIVFAYGSLLLLVIAFIITRSILRVAFL